MLVVDDDDDARLQFCQAIASAGYEVAEAWSVVQAMRLLLSHTPDAVVLDLILPDGDGAEIGRAMRAIVTTQGICVVAVTANPAALPLQDPATFGARTILTKPLSIPALLEALGECFPASGPTLLVDGPAGPRASDTL
ncbi:MAG: response regulator [Gemmatimonadetes bacterium]|nr:response regulator [Gemmatimonadota bacterium]